MKNHFPPMIVLLLLFLPALSVAQKKLPGPKKLQNPLEVILSNTGNFGGCALMRDRYFGIETGRPARQKALPDSLLNRPFGGAPLLPGDKSRELLDRSRELRKRYGKKKN